MHKRLSMTLLTGLVFLMLAALPASALGATPPWNGDPISQGLGPTYGEPWPAPTVDEPAIHSRQGAPLALMPYAAIQPLLEQFKAEAAAAGVPDRMRYWVAGKSAGGRNIYAVEINALETAEQRRNYARWQQFRANQLTDPVQAQADLASWGDDVKMAIFLSHSHGNEYEAVDSNMQIIRDLTVTPYGTNPIVDELLDHAVVVIVPTSNPDGRVLGQRGNQWGIDTNRDYLVQGTPEDRADTRVQQQYLATAALHGHGYYTPTLIDGLTMPHNPGLEYDIFARWNQRRVERNRADFAASGTTGITSIQIPVNDWNDTSGTTTRTYTVASASVPGATQSGSTVTITTTAANVVPVGGKVTISGVPVAGYNGTFRVTSVISSTKFTYEAPTSGLANSGGGTVSLPPQPNLAQGWDDWGPFYGQTYMALLGAESSTVEMTSSTRLASKRAQYLTFYSSARFWLENRNAMMRDQVEIFRRAVQDAAFAPNLIDSDPVLWERYFNDYWHNWQVPTGYPTAYIIPFGENQRSDVEANRLAQWCLDNGIQVRRATSDFTWRGNTYQAGSYIVWMNQALRGLAWNALSAGRDISAGKINVLYASPAAWSHGLCWGADTVEVPRGDLTFAPDSEPITETNSLSGGIRGGVSAASDWYAVTLRSFREYAAIRSLLKSGIRGEIAEAPFTSTTGGEMPAGSLIFPADHDTAVALDAAGRSVGIWFERNVGVAKPATTRVAEAPKLAILVSGTPPTNPNETSVCLQRILGDDVQFISTTTSGANGLLNPTVDPLQDVDVVFTTLTAWPTGSLARDRLMAFFSRGGGYITANVSSLGFLTGTPPALVSGTLTQSSSTAYGGIAIVANVGGANSPITGPYPSRDYMYLPSSITYYSATPTGAVVDERYLPTMSTVGPENGFVAGMWNVRTAATNNAPVLVRGATSVGSRYVAYAKNPFSRLDAEREWPLFVQAALWSNLTDEVTLDEGPAAQTVQYSDGVVPLVVGARDADTAGSDLVAEASGLPAGLTLAQVSNNGSVVPGAASWKVSGDVTAAAGTYDVTVTVRDTVRVTGSVSFTIVVEQEDGALFYNGSVLLPIKVKPTLGSQFWDSAANGYPGLRAEPAGTVGDITKARVRFDVSTVDGASIGTAAAPVVDTGAPGDGIGSASAAFPTASSTEAVWMVTSTLVNGGTGPNGYYAAPADQSGVVVFYDDTGQFVTGGGTVPDGDKKANFGFVARYNKSGKPQGQLVYVFRGTYNGAPATFRIKSNAVTGLAFSGTAYPVTATLEGKATISVCNEAGTQVFGDGNWRYVASVTDTNANPGHESDSFALKVWTKNNELYKSLLPTPLSGGNISIKNPKSR